MKLKSITDFIFESLDTTKFDRTYHINLAISYVKRRIKTMLHGKGNMKDNLTWLEDLKTNKDKEISDVTKQKIMGWAGVQKNDTKGIESN